MGSDDTVHLDDNLPKHEALKNIVARQIRLGVFKAGDRIPSQNEMAEQYGIGQNTVREAITSLVHEGVLMRSQGKGTFVADGSFGVATYAVVVPHICIPGFSNGNGYDVAPQLVSYLSEAIRDRKGRTLLYLDDDDFDTEHENLRLLSKGGVDGIVVLYIGKSRNLDVLRELQATGVPLVLIDRIPQGFLCDFVRADNYAGALAIVEQLLQSSCDRVVHIAREDDSSVALDRRQGYEDAMRKRGRNPEIVTVDIKEDNRVIQMDFPSYQAATQLIMSMSKDERLAIFCVNALAAIGVWRAICDAKVDYKRFVLGCFDDPGIDLPQDFLFLKAIQPLREISRRAIELIAAPKKGGEHRMVTLSPEIQISGSFTAGNRIVTRPVGK